MSSLLPAMPRLHPRAAPANVAPPKQLPMPKLPGLSRAGLQAGGDGKRVPTAHNRRGPGCQGPCWHGRPPIQDMAGARQKQQPMWEHSGMGKVGSGYANVNLHV